MNRLEYLLGCLGEEGCEVGQMTSKCNRFGVNEIFPEQPLTNAQRTHLELDDVWAVAEMLNEEFGFGYSPNRDRIEAKKAKVNKYYKYSESLGLVTLMPTPAQPAAPADCERCKGSGEMEGFVDKGGGDGYYQTVNCVDCGGTGEKKP